MNSKPEFVSFKLFVDNLNSESVHLIENQEGEFEFSYQNASVQELKKLNSFLDDLRQFN